MTDRQLDGARFVRVFPRVYRAAAVDLSEQQWVDAARLALPPDAHLTGISRLQRLGLDYRPLRPLRFVVDRDLHLDLEDIFLHRTKRLPPVDEVGVVVPAAFVAYCARARVVDAIKVGDWLLGNRHTTSAAIRDLALSALWRDGAHEAVWVLDHLDGRSRSLKESETRAVLVFAGLPRPEVNVAVDVGEDVVVVGDLVYREFGVAVEYEGAHHQADRSQYLSDVDRYALLRHSRVNYVQVTNETLARPKTVVGEVYRQLLAGGYSGPPPKFEDLWRLLFLPVSVAVGPRWARITGRAVG